MGKIRKGVLKGGTMAHDSTTETAVPAGDWMTAEEWGKVGFDFEMRARTGLMEGAVGYQTCNVPDAPDAHVTVTTFRASNGVTFRASFTDTTGNTGGKQLVRPVWVLKLTSGSTLATCWLGGAIYIIEP